MFCPKKLELQAPSSNFFEVFIPCFNIKNPGLSYMNIHYRKYLADKKIHSVFWNFWENSIIWVHPVFLRQECYNIKNSHNTNKN